MLIFYSEYTVRHNLFIYPIFNGEKLIEIKIYGDKKNEKNYIKNINLHPYNNIYQLLRNSDSSRIVGTIDTLHLQSKKRKERNKMRN